jgi:hypothetical protein
MRRALVVFGVMLAAMVAAGPTAGARPPQRGFIFYTHADGFYLEGRGMVGSGRIRFLLDRRGEVAYYYVRARVGAGTVKARFGRLGMLDLRFAPSRGSGPLGCGADEDGLQPGRFRGAIVFHGEHDYANVDAGSARGWFATVPREGCGTDRRRAPRTAAARASRVGPIAETGARLIASMSPRIPDLYFYAVPAGRRGTERVASLGVLRSETRGAMRIERGAQVLGGAKTFEWDLGRGIARVEPPAPFTGRAFYRRGAPGRPARWTGSLRVPILGGKPLRLTGSAFDVHLGRGT